MKIVDEKIKIKGRIFEDFGFLFCEFWEFERSTLKDCTFKACDINADIKNVHFENCTFIECSLTHIHLNKCIFINCEFYNCNLQGISMISCKGEVCKDLTLYNCKIDGANLGTRIVSCLDDFADGNYIYYNIDNRYINMCDTSNLRVCDLEEFKRLSEVYENIGRRNLSSVYKFFIAMGGL